LIHQPKCKTRAGACLEAVGCLILVSLRIRICQLPISWQCKQCCRAYLLAETLSFSSSTTSPISVPPHDTWPDSKDPHPPTPLVQPLAKNGATLKTVKNGEGYRTALPNADTVRVNDLGTKRPVLSLLHQGQSMLSRK